MNRKTFHSAIPAVFANCENLHSEVWGRQLTFERGKTYLLEADSGQGKSTFCSYVIGYRHDYEGTISFDNVPVSKKHTNWWVDVRKQHIAYLFQELRLFPELTAYENVEIKNRLTGCKTHAQITAWFERLGIADKMDTKVALLSFGQQQRVAMLRALAQPFDFLLADEPVSHLDDENAALMGRLMMEEAQRRGAGVIVTSIGKHFNMHYDQIIHL